MGLENTSDLFLSNLSTIEELTIASDPTTCTTQT